MSPSHNERPTVWTLLARANEDETDLRIRARAMTAEAAWCSRSYRYPHALVAVHTAPVGLDIERISTCDNQLLIAAATPTELTRLLAPETRTQLAIADLWSSKEALAKALGTPLAYEPTRLESPAYWPAGSANRWRAERFPAPPGHVAWLCWTPTATQSRWTGERAHVGPC